MRVEEPSADDCRAIARVHVASWQRAYAGLLPADYLATLSVPEREAQWRQAIESGLPSLLVARDGDAIVGFIACGPSRDVDAPPQRAEVFAFYLDPTVWSRGVGRMLWSSARDAWRAKGCRSIGLWVIVGNDRAVRFYVAAGFRPDPGSSQTFELGGVPLQEMRYLWHADG